MNGAGKSTLLRILGGLDSAHVESAHWRGEPIALMPYPPALRGVVV